MIKAVFFDIAWYLLMWLVLLLLFTFIYIILGVQTCEHVNCDMQFDSYKGVDTLTQAFIHTYRSSIGDLNAPLYDWMYAIKMDPVKLKKQGLSYNQIKAFIYAIWIVWAANCFINTIIFLNILVAEVNNTYQKIMTESEVLDVSVTAELNFMYNKYWRVYRWSQYFLNDFIRKIKRK